MTVNLSGPPDDFHGSHLDLEQLKARAGRVLTGLGLSRSELSLALVGDSEIRELNGTYRSTDRPTDVLSFSLVEGEHADFRGALLGDVVISVETAQHQARERHRSLDEELTRLLIHGVLHLIGHDHEDDAEFREMRDEERRLWRLVTT